LGDIFLPQRAVSVYFSGKDAWIEPSSLVIQPLPAGPSFPFVIKTILEADKKAVTYFDKEKLKEDLETKLPVVRIEINQEIKIPRKPGNKQPECCFENCPSEDYQYISLYQLLRDLHVEDAVIKVEVCGVKNLLVRSDENLLNVNSPMAVFGVRPKVDSSFYIGSKEIFSKNWKDIYINTEWKDRPVDFSDHYKHYFYENFEDGSSQITNDSFKLKAALLEKGGWLNNGTKNLFAEPSEGRAPFCTHPAPAVFQNVYHYARASFAGSAYMPLPVDTAELPPLDVNSTYGFLKLTLKGVGFQHDRYPFVLARHMMALSDLVDPVSLNAAIIRLGTVDSLITAIQNRVDAIKNEITSLQGHISTLTGKLTLNPGNLSGLVASLNGALNTAKTLLQGGSPDVLGALASLNTAIGFIPQINNRIAEILGEVTGINTDVTDINNIITQGIVGLQDLLNALKTEIAEIKKLLKVDEALENGLPKEAYTPLAKDLSLDYTAEADISDIELVHLYPFENTHKEEEITLKPALFPTHCDQGTLFIGLKQLVPGSNVNFLFQLAEATANSESDAAEVVWHYLSNNQWKPLRSGFEVIEDATNRLTTSGIVKISIPADINTDNTLLPNSLHWIKASAPRNVIAVSETLGIHTQAVRATFVNTAAHDQMRLSAPLKAGKLSKLQEANANVKKVAQPYESFGGKVPEAEGNYYIRVSEWLRHKGRGIQKFDYERLVLDAFPEIYKVKCINHSFWAKATLYRTDVNVAPGYVMVAVIPDLNKLKSGQSFEPKAPLSLLEKIAASLKKRTSPFARIKVVNPRYEKIDICIRVALHKGKDRVFYRNKLAEDLRLFLAPWAVGEFEKLDFGQCVNRSDVVRFIEGRDYVDYIIDLKMMFEEGCTPDKVESQYEVCPLTPRSILVAGEIDVCIPEFDCDQWDDVPDRCSRQFPVTTLECRPPATDNPIPVEPIG
ncbi:MAG TPA: hypothetical protein VGB46_04535, partial [Flavisolibacter sp.]